MTTTVIILAAGKGTRMRSSLPKVLQPLAGRPLLGHVIQTAKQLHAQNIITIYGHGGEHVQQQFQQENIQWVEQAEQLGTGHAVQMTLPVLPQEGMSLILYGDVPLVRQETLDQLLAVSSATGIGMITLNVDNPTGYGRIIRETTRFKRLWNIKMPLSNSVRFRKSILASIASVIRNCTHGCQSYRITTPKVNTISPILWPWPLPTVWKLHQFSPNWPMK